MKKIIKVAIVMFLVVAPMFFSVTVNADIGPKSSVHIIFENMGDEKCYGTLLSSTESTGPSSVWNGEDYSAKYKEKYEYATLDYETWKAFVEYQDVDGYYFLQEAWDLSEENEIAWTYYPPNDFKILLYYPESETFVVSEIYEKYAFDTYYIVDMEGINIGSVEYSEDLSTDARIEAYRAYNYKKEVIALIIRMLITILVELVVALPFGFRKGKQILLIAGANIVTQIILNVLLNVLNYNRNSTEYFMLYVVFEIFVVAVEALLYCTLLKKLSKEPKKNWMYVLYTVVANGVSLGVGVIVAEHIIYMY